MVSCFRWTLTVYEVWSTMKSLPESCEKQFCFIYYHSVFSQKRNVCPIYFWEVLRVPTYAQFWKKHTDLQVGYCYASVVAEAEWKQELHWCCLFITRTRPTEQNSFFICHIENIPGMWNSIRVVSTGSSSDRDVAVDLLTSTSGWVQTPQLVSMENPGQWVDVKELTSGEDEDITRKGTDEALTESTDQGSHYSCRWSLGTRWKL